MEWITANSHDRYLCAFINPCSFCDGEEYIVCLMFVFIEREITFRGLHYRVIITLIST